MSEGTELALVGGVGTTIPTISELCTKDLSRHLLAGGETKRAVWFALQAPNARELVDKAKEILPRLKMACEPCGSEAIRLVLQPLALLFGVPPGRTAKMWDTIYAEYFDALAEFPLVAVIAGIKDYRDDPESRFFPLPGQLKGRIEPHAIKLRTAAYRAKIISEAVERIPAPKPTDEDRAKVAAMLAELGGQIQRRGGLAEPRFRPEHERARVVADLRRRADLEASPPASPDSEESELFD